jgi:peptidylprolyl isomerase
MTIGRNHPRLPGLGLALVGLAPGEKATVNVPAEQAYGSAEPGRIRRWHRRRFPGDAILEPGARVHVTDAKGRRRRVRVVEVGAVMVVVDTNHPWAGQALRIDLKLVAIGKPRPHEDLWQDEGGEA